MMRRLAGLGLSGAGGKKGAAPAATAISRHVFKLLNDQARSILVSYMFGVVC